MNRPGDTFATIYTDASFDDRSHRGAYAYYIKTSKGVIQDRGAASNLDNSNHAEMLAIYKAVEAVVNKWPDLNGVFVNTDSLACCEIFWPFRPTVKGRGRTREVYEALVRLLNGRWTRAKHVKGHTGGNDVRSYLNNKVDNFARNTMRGNRKGPPTVASVAAVPVPRTEGPVSKTTALRPGQEFTDHDMEWDEE